MRTTTSGTFFGICLALTLAASCTGGSNFGGGGDKAASGAMKEGGSGSGSGAKKDGGSGSGSGATTDGGSNGSAGNTGSGSNTGSAGSGSGASGGSTAVGSGSGAGSDANGLGTGSGAVGSGSLATGSGSSATVTPPPNSVTKGSFTVWCEPAKPAEYQDYKIYIQVKFPTPQASYTRKDLTGDLLGTDDYDQDIGDDGDDVSFNASGDGALLVIEVPGSYSHVQDTINIKSAALNESQQIILTFQ